MSAVAKSEGVSSGSFLPVTNCVPLIEEDRGRKAVLLVARVRWAVCNVRPVQWQRKHADPSGMVEGSRLL